MARDIVYIDVDDEITSVVGKIEATKSKVVALVPPKHASVISSIVSLKLLKKAAEANKRSIVIISNDQNTIALAGTAGIHIAKTLKSKPVLPSIPNKESESDVVSSEDLDKITPEQIDAAESADDVIQLDNTTKVTKSVSLGPKNKKLKVPNFNRFRIKLFLAIFAVIALISGGVYAFFIAPTAKITLKTEVSSIDTNLDITLSTAVKEFDASKMVLPATQYEKKVKDTETVTATGKKDVGTKATGTMTVINCSDNEITVPAGTSFSNSGFTFTLDNSVTVPASDFFSAANGGACKKNGKATGPVTATVAGGSSNLSSGREYSSSIGSTVTGSGSAMGGGTSKLVTVVSADDIDGAKSRWAGRSKNAATQDLLSQAEAASMLAINETLTDNPPVFSSSVEPDTEAVTATVTAETLYTMLAVSPANIQKLFEDSISSKISDSQQKILKNGLDQKTVELIEKKSPGEQRLKIGVIATVGPDINTVGIADEVAGKSRGEIQTMLSKRAGIKDVTVTYNPFWVTGTPKKASKITVTVEQVNAAQ